MSDGIRKTAEAILADAHEDDTLADYFDIGLTVGEIKDLAEGYTELLEAARDAGAVWDENWECERTDGHGLTRPLIRLRSAIGRAERPEEVVEVV